MTANACTVHVHCELRVCLGILLMDIEVQVNRKSRIYISSTYKMFCNVIYCLIYSVLNIIKNIVYWPKVTVIVTYDTN